MKSRVMIPKESRDACDFVQMLFLIDNDALKCLMNGGAIGFFLHKSGNIEMIWDEEWEKTVENKGVSK